MDELKEASEMFSQLKQSNEIHLKFMPPEAMDILKVFDGDGDGTVDVGELAMAAQMYKQSKESNKKLGKMIFGLMFVILVMVGLIGAMMFTVVEMTKESRTASDGVMRSNTPEAAVVKTGSAISDMNGTRFTTSDGKTVGVKSVLETVKLSSGLPDAAFKQLKQFEVVSPTGAYVSLAVAGWYRVPSKDAATGSFVKIITHVGFIALDGEEMSFEETMGHVFSESGFKVDGGRKLLGMYEIIGMFNSVDEWEGLDVATGEKPPGFGKKSFSMTYETYHKCGAVGSNSACFSPLYSTPHGAVRWIKKSGASGGGANGTDLTEPWFVTSTNTSFDVKTGSTLEILSNPEFPNSIKVIFKSAARKTDTQITNGKSYYCEEELENHSPSYDIESAAKIGEEMMDGVAVRHFMMETKVSEQQHLALHNFDDTVPYTGLFTINYYDNRETLHPVKFTIGTTVMKVVSFEEGGVNLPEGKDPVWDMPKDCVGGDPLKDFSLPSVMPTNAKAWDSRTRDFPHCVNDPTSCEPSEAIGAGAEPEVGDDGSDIVFLNETEESSSRRRQLLSSSCSEAESAKFPQWMKGGCGPKCDGGPHPNALWPVPKHSGDAGLCAFPVPYNPRTKQAAHWGGHSGTSSVKWAVGKYKFNMAIWQAGCGIKSIKVDAACGAGVKCWGTCAGTTQMLCQSRNTLTCGAHVEADLFRMAGEKPKKIADKLGLAASIGVDLVYTSVGQTISLGFWGYVKAGNLRRRQMLEAHEAGEAESIEEQEEADAAEGGGRRRTLLTTANRDQHDALRQLRWGVVGEVVEAVTPKIGIEAKVYGLGSLSLESGLMKVSAGIDIRLCFFGCDSFTIDIVRAEGQLFTPEPKPDMSDTPGFVQTTVLAKYVTDQWPGDFLAKARTIDDIILDTATIGGAWVDASKCAYTKMEVDTTAANNKFVKRWIFSCFPHSGHTKSALLLTHLEGGEGGSVYIRTEGGFYSWMPWPGAAPSNIAHYKFAGRLGWTPACTNSGAGGYGVFGLKWTKKPQTAGEVEFPPTWTWETPGVTLVPATDDARSVDITGAQVMMGWAPDRRCAHEYVRRMPSNWPATKALVHYVAACQDAGGYSFYVHFEVAVENGAALVRSVKAWQTWGHPDPNALNADTEYGKKAYELPVAQYSNGLRDVGIAKLWFKTTKKTDPNSPRIVPTFLTTQNPGEPLGPTADLSKVDIITAHVGGTWAPTCDSRSHTAFGQNDATERNIASVCFDGVWSKVVHWQLKLVDGYAYAVAASAWYQAGAPAEPFDVIASWNAQGGRPPVATAENKGEGYGIYPLQYTIVGGSRWMWRFMTTDAIGDALYEGNLGDLTIVANPTQWGSTQMAGSWIDPEACRDTFIVIHPGMANDANSRTLGAVCYDNGAAKVVQFTLTMRDYVVYATANSAWYTTSYMPEDKASFNIDTSWAQRVANAPVANSNNGNVGYGIKHLEFAVSAI